MDDDNTQSALIPRSSNTDNLTDNQKTFSKSGNMKCIKVCIGRKAGWLDGSNKHRTYTQEMKKQEINVVFKLILVKHLTNVSYVM